MDTANINHTEIAVLGGGCFWCLEATLSQIKGVHSVRPAYAHGHITQPTYEQVCTGQSGHIEVIEVTFNPQQLSYHDLLLIFFASHDPTSLDKQGNDIGSQYRSAIIWQNTTQQHTAQTLIQQLTQQNTFDAAIVTELIAPCIIWPAESIHQDYFARNPQQGYCTYVIRPKVMHIRQQFTSYLKD